MINLDDSPEDKDLSPGKLLLQGRLDAGLTQEQIAKELYLTTAKVIALEQDDYERLESETFVRGYIRAYANLLKLDGVVILTAYEKKLKKIKAPYASVTEASAAMTSNKSTWKFVAKVVFLCVGLWVISIWVRDDQTEKNYAVPSVSMPSAIDSASSSSVEQHSSLFSGAITTNVVLPENQIQMTAIADESSVIASATAQSSISSTAPLKNSVDIEKSSLAVVADTNSKAGVFVKKNELDEISFMFREECWLEVSDSRGDVLATELQSAGSQLKLVGKAPFDVKLGNSPVVDIQLNGKKIIVIPLATSKVLTLTVDEKR